MSTPSSILRLELITTGDQAGTWGNTTNTNLGTLLEGSIAGLASVSVTSANQALVATDYAADEARMALITLTTTTTANFNVYAPPVSKQYVIYNNSSYTATIYNGTVANGTTAAGTGVAIPAGKITTVWSNGTNFYKADTALVSLTTDVSGTLPVANGGTGSTTASGARTNLGLVIGTDVPSPTGTGASGTWAISISGNAATATSATSATTATTATSATNVTGTVAVANGGTGSTTASGARTNLDVPSTGGSGASGTWGINITGNAATASNAGVTSVNSQTGAVVTTTLGNIGSIIIAAANITSSMLPGDTISGSNLYYPTTISQDLGSSGIWTQGSSTSGNPRTFVSPTNFGRIDKNTDGNTGFTAPGGCTSLSGTWRAMNWVPSRVINYDSENNLTMYSIYMSIFVRVS